MPQNQIPPSTRMIDGKVIVNANVDNAEARIAKLENAPAPPPGGGAVSSVDGRAGAVTLDDLYPPVLASIAALRAITTTTATVVAVLGYNAGSGEGGGLFRLDSADTTTVDDSGLVIVDASGNRWKRVLTNNNLTPDMFGAQSFIGTDATAQVQAMLNKVRASYDNGSSGYRYVADLGGKMWRVNSVDATAVRSPGMEIKNGGLYGTGAGRTVLDMSGSNACEISDISIWGDKTNEPGVGLLLAKMLINGRFPDAKQHRLINVSTNGFFSKSPYINFASEVCYHSGCTFLNKSRSLSAVSVAIAGSAATFDQYIGGVTSDYVTIPVAADGPQSCIEHDLGQLQAMRNADVNLPITSITRTNPAAVTVDAAALASSGLANGDRVYFYNVAGMTELNKFSYAIANLNTNAGTFQLSATDSTTYGAFVSGNVQNQTGSAVLLGSCSGVSCRSGYLLAYGSDAIKWDMKRGPARGIDLSLQMEHQPSSAIFFDIPSTGALMQDVKLNFHSISQGYRDAALKAPAGTGVLRIDALQLTLADLAANPSQGLVQNRQRFALRGAKIHTPLSAALTPTMATAVGSGFASISGEVYAADTDTLDTYGTRVAH